MLNATIDLFLKKKKYVTNKQIFNNFLLPLFKMFSFIWSLNFNKSCLSTRKIFTKNEQIEQCKIEMFLLKLCSCVYAMITY